MNFYDILFARKMANQGDITTEGLSVTENGTYTAPTGKAYTPVVVNVEGYAKKSIANTPTAIATFNASALPMPSLSVGIEAVQDLHGYDNPWPAGGGKNKCDIGTTTFISSKTYPLVLSAGTYTISANITSSDTDRTTTLFIIKNASSTDRVTGRLERGNRASATFTITEESATITLYAGYNDAESQGDTATWADIQIETGSTATAYAPYSNECPISGWSAVNVYDTGKNLFDSNITISNNYYNDNGEEITSATTGHSALTKVKSSTLYKVFIYAINSSQMGGKWGVYYWDSNKNFISRNVVDYAIDYTQNAIVFTTPNNCKYISFQLPIGTGVTIGGFDKTKCFLYENDTTSPFEAYSGTTYTTTLKDGQGNPMTCYGGTLSNENGVQRLTLTHGYIASYNGETLPSTWISDRDVYAEGTTPTTGAEVVYTLATPQQIPQDSLSIATQEGTNNIWADTGDIQSGEYMEEL